MEELVCARLFPRWAVVHAFFIAIHVAGFFLTVKVLQEIFFLKSSTPSPLIGQMVLPQGNNIVQFEIKSVFQPKFPLKLIFQHTCEGMQFCVVEPFGCILIHHGAVPCRTRAST